MFVFGYYKEFTFVLSFKNGKLFYKENPVNRRIYHRVNWRSMLMTLNVLLSLKFNYDCNEALFYKCKMNSRGVYVIMKETRQEGFIQV